MTAVRDLIGRLSFDRMSPRDRRALGLGAALLTPVLLWSMAVRPYLAALEDVEARIEAERGRLEREEALLAAAPRLPEALEHATEAARSAESRLIKAANQALAEAELISYLTLVASTNHLLLQEARAVESTGEAPAGLAPVQLALRGESNLEGVLEFLHAIEQSPLLLRVVGLSIEPAPPAQSTGGGRGGNQPQPRNRTGVLQLNLLIEAYTPSHEPDTGEVS